MKRKMIDEASLIFSYLTLRKTIGFLGIALPFLVSLGALAIFQTGFRGSISGYYYTGMRDVFVGVLWAIGVFLFSYKGYGQEDDWAGNLACIFAIGVTLFPTTPECVAASNCPPTLNVPQAQVVGYLHFFFAACFFLTLSYFSIFLFTRTNPKGKPPMTRRKLLRNRIYRICGYLMVFCIVLIGVYSFVLSKAWPVLESYHPIYWLEALAIVTFGVSWIIKGEAILKDEA